MTFSFSRALRVSALAGVFLIGSVPGSAEGAAPDAGPEATLRRGVDDFRRANGVEKYAALRALWKLWDQVDPGLVEEAIGDVERDKAESAPVRTYAAAISPAAWRRSKRQA